MKRISTLILTLFAGSSALAQSERWDPYGDYCDFYGPPVCSYESGPIYRECRYSRVPLPRFRGGPVGGYGEVWEHPGWVPPVAQRPPARGTGWQRPVLPPSEKTLPAPRPTAQPKVPAEKKLQPVLTEFRPQTGERTPSTPPKNSKENRKIEILVPVESREEAAELSEVAGQKNPEVAVPVPGSPGFVFSPFDEEKRKVDVRGLPSGSRARDPYTKQVFVVP